MEYFLHYLSGLIRSFYYQPFFIFADKSKVQVFQVGHKNLMKSSTWFDVYFLDFNLSLRFRRHFVGFLENPNLIISWLSVQEKIFPLYFPCNFAILYIFHNEGSNFQDVLVRTLVGRNWMG